jgi:hypothetical protein
MRTMAPVTSAEGIDLRPDVVLPIMLVAIVLVLLAVVFRSALVGTLDELADLWRTYGPVAVRRALDHRPGLAATPWFCDRCHSSNGLAASRCYKCGARREEAEASLPDAEPPAGPGAGLNQRTRQKG